MKFQGYFDDTVNTDNAWVEVHVANVHIEGNFSTVPPAVSTVLSFIDCLISFTHSISALSSVRNTFNQSQ